MHQEELKKVGGSDMAGATDGEERVFSPDSFSYRGSYFQ